MDYEKTNLVVVSGKVVAEPEFSHELIGGEKFYECYLEVRRLSGAVDTIPVTVSQKIIMTEPELFKLGSQVEINGEFRSHNREEEGRSKLLLSVFCKQVKQQEGADKNIIKLDGYVCKPTNFRTTPFNRQINDILLAVNRPLYKKTDYIPLIAWGRNAIFAQKFQVGDRVIAEGRIQSRQFIKNIDGVEQTKTAYEISVQDLSLADEDVAAHIEYEEKYPEKIVLGDE